MAWRSATLLAPEGQAALWAAALPTGWGDSADQVPGVVQPVGYGDAVVRLTSFDVYAGWHAANSTFGCYGWYDAMNTTGRGLRNPGNCAGASNWGGRIRTCNFPSNSRAVCQLTYTPSQLPSPSAIDNATKTKNPSERLV